MASTSCLEYRLFRKFWPENRCEFGIILIIKGIFKETGYEEFNEKIGEGNLTGHINGFARSRRMGYNPD